MAYQAMTNSKVDLAGVPCAHLLQADLAHRSAILAAIPDLIFVIDADGTFLDVHAPAPEDLFVAPSEFLGRRVEEVLPPALAELTLTNVRQVLHSGTMLNYETDGPLPSGEHAFFENRMVPCGPSAVLAIVRNITERRQAQHALQLAQFTIEHVSQPIIVVNEAGAIPFANASAVALLGQDLPMRKIWEIDTALSPKRWAQQWHDLKSKGSMTFDTSLVGEGGATLHFEVSSSFLHFNGFEYVVRYAHNVTERKRTAQTLSASEELLRQVIEQSSDGITIIDTQGYIIEWNRRLEELTGLSRYEVTGHPLWEVQYALAPPAQRTPEDYERLQMLILEALQTGDAPWFHRPVSRPLERPDGTCCTVETITYPIRTRAGTMLGSIMREVMPVRVH